MFNCFFLIDFVGIAVSVFCFGSLGHAPKQYNKELIAWGIVGFLPLIIHCIVLTIIVSMKYGW